MKIIYELQCESDMEHDIWEKIGEFDNYKDAEEAAGKDFDSHGSKRNYRIIERHDDWDGDGWVYKLPAYRFEIRECPKCGKKVRRVKMTMTEDCHGIPFRLVCDGCYDKLMTTNGYDGAWYSAADECF